MSTVNLSSASRTGLTVLRNVAKDMAETQNRLVTGKAVNSPIDNATKFFTAAAMDNRAAALDALQDSVTTAQATVKAGSEGIKGIQNMIKQARSIANQAVQSNGDQATVTGTATLTGATALAPTGAEAITVSDGTTTVSFGAAATDKTVQGFIDAINNNAALKVNAGLNSDGKLVLKGEGGSSVIVAQTSGTNLTTVGVTAATTAAPTNEVRKNLAAQFDQIRGEIDKLVGDAGVGGTNLLQGDSIKLSLNETGSSTTEIKGANISSTGLGISDSSVTANFQTNASIEASLESLDSASKSLESVAANLGGSSAIIDARVDFNRQISDILKTGANDIVAADMDQEAANLVALQTRQQMAATSLSIIQSSEATALRLIS